MLEVTRILNAIAAGDPDAAADLQPLVYDELRGLAAARMVAESPDHTLQPTALVHEAYVRLVGGGQPRDWNRRGHFFATAAEAMRRVLIDHARSRLADKRGGDRQRVRLDGGGPGGGPRIFGLSAADLLTGSQREVTNFFAGDVNNRGGVRLTVKDLDGDERGDLVVGTGEGAGSRVTTYLGKDIPLSGTPRRLATSTPCLGSPAGCSSADSPSYRGSEAP